MDVDGSNLIRFDFTTNDPYPAIPARLIVARYRGFDSSTEQSYEKYKKGMPPEIYQWHFRDLRRFSANRGAAKVHPAQPTTANHACHVAHRSGPGVAATRALGAGLLGVRK